MELEIIKNYLKNNEIDAWVIYDYECTNTALINLLGKKPLSRKLFLIIPAIEKPYIICHDIDMAYLNNSEVLDKYTLIPYKCWEDLQDKLSQNLSNYNNIIMEISEFGLLPNASYCDYGTIELIKKYVKNINSSANLLMKCNSILNKVAFESHTLAMQKVVEIKDKAFKLIEDSLKSNKYISEYDVQQYILSQFKSQNLVTDSAPIVAVNSNAGLPHYEPKENNSTEIKKGDLILIDLWAREDSEDSVFADITWMGYAGKNPPQEYIDIFDIIKDSIEEALLYINSHLPVRKICGYEVDDVVRNYIKSKGYGDYFIHRTGHSISIAPTPHGNGVNMDNYETHDTRQMINNICFSIEPGIYTKDFGFREEINVFIENDKAIATSPIQQELITMNI